MAAWWGSISAFQRFFWCFAIPFSLIFLIQTLMTFLGLGGGEDVDIPDDPQGIDDIQGGEGHSGFILFTFQNIVVFFTVFGWAGIFGIHAGFSEVVTSFLAFLMGLIVMFIVAGLYFMMSRLTESGNISLTNAVGAIGTVYLPIPHRRSGSGQVQLSIQGSIREIEAMTDGEPLPTGTLVQVTTQVNNQIVLVKRADTID